MFCNCRVDLQTNTLLTMELYNCNLTLQLRFTMQVGMYTYPHIQTHKTYIHTHTYIYLYIYTSVYIYSYIHLYIYASVYLISCLAQENDIFCPVAYCVQDLKGDLHKEGFHNFEGNDVM